MKRTNVVNSMPKIISTEPETIYQIFTDNGIWQAIRFDRYKQPIMNSAKPIKAINRSITDAINAR